MNYISVRARLHSIKRMQYNSLTEDEYKILDILNRDRPDLVKWTDQEKFDFNEGLQLYGKDFDKICELVPTKNKAKMNTYVRSLKLEILQDPNHPDAHLMPILETKLRKRDYSLFNPDENKRKVFCKLKNYTGDKTETME